MRICVPRILDGPEELFDQVPMAGTLLRSTPGPDRADYWLVRLDQPLEWFPGGTPREIAHVLLATRHVGVVLVPGGPRVSVGLSFVVDESLLGDEQLDLRKCVYVAVADCEVGDVG